MTLMQGFISDSVSSFSRFLSEKHQIFKNPTNTIVSFAIEQNHFSLSNRIDTLIKLHERSFYFEKPSEDFLFIGINEALVISENGDKRFAATAKKIKELKNNFINNWNVIPVKDLPLFIGGMKFCVEHSDEDWKDFNDSTWFIPEILIMYKGSRSYLFYNFILASNPSLENAAEKFKKRLTYLFNIEKSKQSAGLSEARSINGYSPKDKKKWKNQVKQALEKIEENQVKKVVLSRKIEILLSSEPSFDNIINKLKPNFPNCYLFIYHHGRSTFFGATPEKLAKFTNGKIEIDALAGSAPRGNDNDADIQFEKELLSSSKNLTEHKLVVDYIKNNISELTENIKTNKEYSVKKLSNIQHLWTSLSANINSHNSPFNLLYELYPTPAICGFPKDAALQLIKKLEGHKRGMYSGILGWFNFEDEGEFVVAIRSALTYGNKIIAFAGNGIVQGSEPDLEYEETELKLKTILSLFTNES